MSNENKVDSSSLTDGKKPPTVGTGGLEFDEELEIPSVQEWKPEELRALFKVALQRIIQDPRVLSKEPDDSLLSLHLRLHQLFGQNFAGNDKLRVGGLLREDLVNCEIFVQEEMKRRGFKHEADDKLSEEAANLRRSPTRKELDFAPIYPSGGNLGDAIRMEDVLHHFKSFKLRMPFLYLVGGLANHGNTVNDIDVLVRGPVSEEMRDVIEFRLGRMLPPALSKRLQLLGDEYGGPFTNHVELADLVVQMRPGFELKRMRDVRKGDDPLLDWPKKAGPHPASLQYHFRGKSLHGDLRFMVDDYLVGWTVALQRSGAVPDVKTTAEAKRIASAFDPNGSRYNKPMIAPAKVYSTPKSRQPTDWLGIKAEVFEPGTVGATRFEEGVIVSVDEPRVEWGLQKPYSHEYFVTKGDKLNGIIFFRLLVGEGGEETEGKTPPGETFWTSFISKEHLPSVLGKRAVETKSMPPDGKSALPKSLEDEVPDEFRYWLKKGEEARKIRDELVASKWATNENIRLVDKEFRRTTTKVFLASKRKFQAPPVDVRLSAPIEMIDISDPEWEEQVKEVPDGTCLYLPITDPSQVAVIRDVIANRGGRWLVSVPAGGLAARLSLSTLGRPYRVGELWMVSAEVPGGVVEWLDPVSSDLTEEMEKQLTTVPFVVSWQSWKGPTVIRATPSREVWRLLLQDPQGRGLLGWELKADPLSGEEKIAAVRRDFADRDLLQFTGDVDPGGRVGGTVLNETKDTPSWIEILTEGKAQILEAQKNFYKIRLKSPDLSGVFTLVSEADPLWLFSRGERPGRAIEKREEIKEVRLADGTVLSDVQVWDPKKISPNDDRDEDRKRLRPLALIRPMKVSGRKGTEGTKFEDLSPFITPEALKSGIVVDPKYNGFRYIVEKDEGGRLLLIGEESFTRKEPIPNAGKVLPELSKELEGLDGPLMLDCEFMAYEDGNAVPRRDLARYRVAEGTVDDSAVRLECFRALYLPKVGNLTGEGEEENRKRIEKFLKGKKHLAPVPYRVAHSEADLKKAIEWASGIPGSEGAMLKLAGTTYSLGGETDSWAKLRPARVIHAIVYRKDPVKDAPGVFTLFGAIGPISAADRDKWKETIEVGGRWYVAIGKTFNSALKVDIGDRIAVEATEILVDYSGPKRTIHWFLPVVQEEPWKGEIDTPDDVERLAGEGEIKKSNLAFEKTVSLLKTAEERFVLGVVLEPETIDAQNDIYSEEVIRTAAHKFMEDYRRLGLMHQRDITERIRILESYLAPVDFMLDGQHVKKGTWIFGIRVLDDELWSKVKDGTLTGFSIGGSAVRQQESSHS